MGKAPAFQFYVRDWLSDPQLQSTCASTRGIWINCLCFMWESNERGKLSGQIEKLARLLNSTREEFLTFLNECKETNFAEIETTPSVTFPLHVTQSNIFVTLINRRMAREENTRNLTKLRVRKYRDNKPCNDDITHASSSSSSNNPIIPLKINENGFNKFYEKYPSKKSKGQALKTWNKLQKAKVLPPVEIILSAIEKQISEKKILISQNKFCPEWKYPATWLNAMAWEDQESISQKPKTKIIEELQKDGTFKKREIPIDGNV